MDRAVLYLSGCGTLDGSDPVTAVLTMSILQQEGITVQPVGRDIDQGQVINHRTLQQSEEERNALDEAARIFRGNIQDFKNLDPDRFDSAWLMGGGGTLSTWTDYHQRGTDCRITERLKYQLLDFHNSNDPIFCLENAGFIMAHILQERTADLRVNVGSNEKLNETIREWGARPVDDIPSSDPAARVACLPDLTRQEDFQVIRKKLRGLLSIFD